MRDELVYMDIVSAPCQAEAVFEALCHYFSDRLTRRWQTKEAPLTRETLTEIDIYAQSLAFSFFQRLDLPTQILFVDIGPWQNDQGPEITYEKTA